MRAYPFPKFLAMSREVRKYHLLRRFVSGICILFLFPALGSAAVPGGLRDTLSVAEKKDSIVEAMITADRHAEQARSQTGHKRLEKGDFIYGNVVFSSPDLIKAIQNLPGVNAGTELMSGSLSGTMPVPMMRMPSVSEHWRRTGNPGIMTRAIWWSCRTVILAHRS